MKKIIKCCHGQLARQCRECKLEARIKYLESIIVNFCVGQQWTVAEWQELPHIKPLFNVTKEVDRGN